MVPIECPLCHTAHAVIADGTLTVDDGWQCARCGQRWSPARLATAATYALYEAAQVKLDAGTVLR
jgi:transposase-like protein